MAYFVVDDHFHGHPKARRAGLDAIGLWAVAGSHCRAYGQDGFVPTWFVETWPKGKQLAARLIAADLWHECEQEGEQGYRFHDWLDIQLSSEETERAKRKARDRQRARRAKLQTLRDGGVTNA